MLTTSLLTGSWSPKKNVGAYRIEWHVRQAQLGTLRSSKASGRGLKGVRLSLWMQWRWGQWCWELSQRWWMWPHHQTHPSPAVPPQVSMMGTTSFLVVSESSYVNPEYLGLIEIGLLGAWFVSYSTELAIFFAYLCHMYWIYFNVHDFKSYIVFIFLLLYICLLIYLLLHRTLCNSKYIFIIYSYHNRPILLGFLFSLPMHMFNYKVCMYLSDL